DFAHPAYRSAVHIRSRGPQKSKSDRGGLNVARSFEKPKRPAALWGYEHPVRRQVSGVSRTGGNSHPQQELLGFQCVTIIAREAPSQGPQVALLASRRYRY